MMKKIEISLTAWLHDVTNRTSFNADVNSKMLLIIMSEAKKSPQPWDHSQTSTDRQTDCERKSSQDKLI